MKRLMNGLFFLTFVSIGLAAAGEGGDQSADADNEMVRLRKELHQIQTQRQNNRQDMEAEQRDFAAYRARTDKRLASARSDIDSVKHETVRNQTRSDSLSSLIQSAQLKKRDIELSRDALRNRLQNSCDKLNAMAIRLSPQSQAQTRSSIDLVKNDLAARTIESPEAFARLAQIIGLMRDATGSIQTSSENSPLPDIRGTCVRLRVGCVMDAVADSKGTVCYLWNGNRADGSPVWRTADDKASGPEIVHAVAVREGKALPSFVNLPLAEVRKGVVQ
jgi:Protein of unknown function (DUF3450)